MERHGYKTHEFGDSVLIELTAHEPEIFEADLLR
jgi:hypothetical protein